MIAAEETVSIARNFDGIAQARTEKPKRQIDVDRDIAEQPVFAETSTDGVEADAQTEAMAGRTSTGLEVFGQNSRLSHRFDDDALLEIMSFNTADRTQAFVKDLQDTPLMTAGELPDPASVALRETMKTELSNVLDLNGQLSHLDKNTLKALVEKQRQCFAGKSPQDDTGMEQEVPPELRAEPAQDGDVAAYFQPCDKWQRPSNGPCEIPHQKV